MRTLPFLVGIAMTVSQVIHLNVNTTIAKHSSGSEVPQELLTDDSTYWSITTLSTMGYVNTTPGAYYNTYKSGGGMIVKFKFKEDGTYEFMLYVQANTYNIENEAWTQIEGTVEFSKDAFGQPVFITHANKGTYRMNRNGAISSRPVPADELAGKFSNTYLWQKTKLQGDANNVYLLVLDLDEHPGVDLKHPENINPDWISRFHIPVQ